MLSTLRLARRLQACLLLALACSVAAASAAPWLGGGHRLTLVCSDTVGARLVVVDADGSTPSAASVLECPLCLPQVGTAPGFHAAAASVPCGDAPAIAGHEVLPSPSSALRPPARAPPTCLQDPSTR